MSNRLALLAAVMLFVLLLTVGIIWQPGGKPAPVAPQVLDYVAPRGYVCYRARGPVTIDGKLDDEAWKAIPWSEDFVDIEGESKPRPRYRTRMKMMWDDENLYIAAELEEPHLQATYEKHDSPIFHQ